MTVVRAYDELTRDGALVARQGSGTFVAKREGQGEVWRAPKRQISRRWAEEFAASKRSFWMTPRRASTRRPAGTRWPPLPGSSDAPDRRSPSLPTS
jgi:hypothetical protein